MSVSEVPISYFHVSSHTRSSINLFKSIASARVDSIDRMAMLLNLPSHIVLGKYDFISFIAEKLRSHEAVLTGKSRAI